MLFDKYVDFIDVYAEIRKDEREAPYKNLSEKEDTAMPAKYIRNKGMEAGIQQGIFTLDDTLADKMRQIRIHGQKVKHQHPLVGINGRLDTMQAAILLEKFSLFPQECALRVQTGTFVYVTLFETGRSGKSGKGYQTIGHKQ